MAVIGTGDCERESEPARMAEEVGRRLAEAGVTVVGGEWGTLSEIGHARTFGKPVVALRSWSLTGRARMEGAPGVVPVETAEEPVAAALEALSS
ncbi:MAG TPA: hypothetical protein VFM94_01495 [Solirubrobacterales bacterium]|nr:hypothetical protein [Solirubrobacterales bacterium]